MKLLTVLAWLLSLSGGLYLALTLYIALMGIK